MSRLVEILGLNHQEPGEIQARSTRNVMSQSEYDEALAIMLKYNSAISPDSVLGSSSVSRAAAAIPTTKTMAFTVTAQSNSYYCGPASAYMVLKHQGYSVTQSGLAGSSYLGTTKDGTNFGSNWTTTLNNYSKHKYVIMWGNSNDTTARAIEMTDAAIGTLASGYGVIYDTVQPSGTSTARLKGYPSYLSSAIYHYVAGRGYSTSDPSNRVCYYVDPNSARADAYGNQTIGFRMMCTLMKTRGQVV